MKRDITNQMYLYFLGGFVEGEGSNSISVTVNKNFKYGINLQPVFNVSQHKNGLDILYSIKLLFEGAGSVVGLKNLLAYATPDIYVYTLKGYKQIIKYVIPFLETYVQPFSCKKEEYAIFKEVVMLSSEGKQRNKEDLIAWLNYPINFKEKVKLAKENYLIFLE